MRRLLPLFAAFGLLGGACGAPAPAAPRFIAVSMTDSMRFEPADLRVAVGETVAITFKNDGLLVHEFFIGTQVAQDAHAAEMAAASPGTGSRHGHGADAADGGIAVEPGMSAVREYTFGEAGTLLVGCHEPGHYEAGMVATITIE